MGIYDGEHLEMCNKILRINWEQLQDKKIRHVRRECLQALDELLPKLKNHKLKMFRFSKGYTIHITNKNTKQRYTLDKLKPYTKNPTVYELFQIIKFANEHAWLGKNELDIGEIKWND